MKWFVAKLIFRIIVSNEKNAQFDIQLRLILDYSIDEALIKTFQIGYKEEERFLSSNGKTVEWKFIGVETINEIADLNNGTLLFSNTQETDSAFEFIAQVKNRPQNAYKIPVNTFVAL